MMSKKKSMLYGILLVTLLGLWMYKKKTETADVDVVIRVDEKITLRILKEEDSEALFALAHRNSETLNKYLPGMLDGWYPTVEKTRALIKRRCDSWYDCQEGFVKQKKAWHPSKDRYILQLGIWYREDAEAPEKLIGCIGLHSLKANPNRVQIGRWVDERYRNKGIGTKCGIKLMDFIFEQIPPLGQVDVWVEVHNKASNRMAEKGLFRYTKTYDSDHYRLGRERWEGKDKLPTDSANHIFLAPLKVEDAPILFEVAHANRAYLIQEYMRSVLNSYRTVEETERLIKERRERWDTINAQLPNLQWLEDKEPYIRELGIWSRSSSGGRAKLIGWIGLKKKDKEGVTLMYWTDRNHGDEEMVKELLAEVIKETLDEMPITYVHYYAATPVQRAIAKRLDFEHLKRHSENYYVMSRSDWEQKGAILKEKYKIY